MPVTPGACDAQLGERRLLTRGDGNLPGPHRARVAQTREGIAGPVRRSEEHLLEAAEAAEERRRQMYLLTFGNGLAVQHGDLT